MRYFSVMVGLRGCYMPDSVYPIAVKTRRELKTLIETEAKYCGNDDEDDGRPPSKRDFASVAAALWRRNWRDRDAYLSTVLPIAPGYGIQINPISGAEYRATKESE